MDFSEINNKILNINFSISGGIKQKLIGVTPIYGRYNKYKKNKALYRIGKYNNNSGDSKKSSQFKVGDDWSDLKKDIKRYYKDQGLDKKAINKASKKLIKSIYKNKLTKDQVNELNTIGYMR